MDISKLEGTSHGQNSGVADIINSIREIRNEEQSKAPNISVLTAADNTVAPYVITVDQERELVAQLRQTAQEQKNEPVAKAEDFWLLACLCARKGDVKRALALASNYLKWRTDVSYHDHTSAQMSPVIREALARGLFSDMGNTSRDGRPVLTIRYRFFNPRVFSALDTARAFAFIVEHMLRQYPKAQTHGMVVVEDAAGFSFANFDIRLIHFLEKAFSQVLPIRISALYIANPGFIVRTIFGLLSGFMSKKLKTRIRLIEIGAIDTFAQYFDPPHIPTFLNLGGTMLWDQNKQDKLVEEICAKSLSWPRASTHEGAH